MVMTASKRQIFSFRATVGGMWLWFPILQMIVSLKTTDGFSSSSSSSFAHHSRFSLEQQRNNDGSSARVYVTQLNAFSSSRSGSRRGDGDRSKRQERVGHLVRTELSRILHTGIIRGRDVEYIEDALRQRISVVSADVSPDLRQARVSVSIRSEPKGSSSTSSGATSSIRGGTAIENKAIDKRKAYSWLVSNTKQIRHTLAQRMSHLKSCPNLTFVQVDVGAAVDVMYLIDKVAQGQKREIDLEEGILTGVIDGVDFDEEDEWMEDDDGFF